MQPMDNDPIFIVARRVVRDWRGDRVYSYFTSGQLLRTLSILFKLRSVCFLPNAPFAGIFGFFNRKTPRLLVRIDQFYGLICERLSVFHWKAIIEGAKSSLSPEDSEFPPSSENARFIAVQDYEMNLRANPYVIAKSFLRPDFNVGELSDREASI